MIDFTNVMGFVHFLDGGDVRSEVDVVTVFVDFQAQVGRTPELGQRCVYT